MKKLEIGQKMDMQYSMDTQKKWHFYRVTVSKSSPVGSDMHFLTEHQNAKGKKLKNNDFLKNQDDPQELKDADVNLHCVVSNYTKANRILEQVSKNMFQEFSVRTKIDQRNMLIFPN